MNEQIKLKEIDDNINIRNNLWNALIITSGGTLSLLINPDNITKKVLIIVGFIFFIIFLNAYFVRSDYINKLLKHNKGEK